jgi:hypothetical protein
LRNLVLAGRVQPHKDNHVGQRKQPLIRLLTRRRCRAHDKAYVPGARQIVEMLRANARQAGNLGVREDLLTRFPTLISTPSSNQHSVTSREASAAGRLRPNSIPVNVKYYFFRFPHANQDLMQETR